MTSDEASARLAPPAFLGPHPSNFTYSSGREEEEEDDDDSNGDYAEVLSPEYEIDRKQIQMIELLGNGQFGEVYRGILKVKYSPCNLFASLSLLQTNQQLEINIAIKTCKMQDTVTTETFLDEACKQDVNPLIAIFRAFAQMSCRNSIIHILLNYLAFVRNNRFY